MNFKLTTPKTCERLDYPLENFPEDRLKKGCPLFNVSKILDPSQIRDHIFRFTAWYFDLDLKVLELKDSIIQTLEWNAYVRMSEKPSDEVSYGRIFVCKDGSGGLTDRGLLAYFYVEDLSNSFGIDVAWTDEDKEITEQSNSMETLGDLVNLFNLILKEAGYLHID